ncbi:MAG: TspO/MBR family protein [Lachnospiraceae bacterium]
MFKKIKFGKLIFAILLPLVIGSLCSFAVTAFGSFSPYPYTPRIMPPDNVFLIVWSILYILMGISSYLANNHSGAGTLLLRQANSTYYYSLAVNVMFCLCFFIFKWTLLSFFVCLYLAIVVFQTVCQYHQVKKAAAYLQIPYLLWSTFASVLTFMIWWLNW